MMTFNQEQSNIAKDTYDVGTTLEFRCVDGTTLVGQSKLLCMENGKL